MNVGACARKCALPWDRPPPAVAVAVATVCARACVHHRCGHVFAFSAFYTACYVCSAVERQHTWALCGVAGLWAFGRVEG